MTEPHETSSSPLVSEAGLVLIDKPRGPSSHQVAAWVRDMLHVPVGHSGTLDPMVSGLLVIMLGRAAKLAPLLLQSDKEYVCTLRLHGEVSDEALAQACRELTGRIYQRPPRRSAVKRNLRIRSIHHIEILERDGRLALLRVECDAGTYIRSLCHHLGFLLGCGGHLEELRRTRSGSFTERDTHSLYELQEAVEEAAAGNTSLLQRLILSPEVAVSDLPSITIRSTAVDALCHGAMLAVPGILSSHHFSRGETVAICTEQGELVCLATALVESSSLPSMTSGFVAAPRAVVMKEGTYQRGWRKRTMPPTQQG